MSQVMTFFSDTIFIFAFLKKKNPLSYQQAQFILYNSLFNIHYNSQRINSYADDI